MALSIKTGVDNNMAINPVAYYDALKQELARTTKGLEQAKNYIGNDAEERVRECAARVENVATELQNAGPKAIEALRALKKRLEIKGDPRARGAEAELQRIEGELGRGRTKVERAAHTQGGDAGKSRASQ